MKTPILLLFFLCITVLSFAQGSYRQGYVVTNSGDTLSGLVDYREGTQVYRLCDFKSSESQNAITYEPGAIVGYGFKSDKVFESRTISLKNKSPQVVFVEVIVRGIVSLYRFENIYFVEKGSDGLQPLLNETVEDYVDGRWVKRNINGHISTMNRLLFDCVEIRDRLHDFRLVEKELTRLIEDYNRCKGGPSTTFKSKKPWTKATFGAIVGINFSKLNFVSSILPPLSGNFAVSKSPVFGISVDVSSPRLSERFAFHSDLLYLTSKYYSYSLFSNSATTERNYVTIEMQQLKLPIGISYAFRGSRLTPYLNMGAAYTLNLRSDPEWIQEIEIEANGVVSTNRFEAPSIEKNQLGVWAGFGLLRPINDRLSATVELRYERTNGISQGALETPLQSNITNFQVSIGIRTR